MKIFSGFNWNRFIISVLAVVAGIYVADLVKSGDLTAKVKGLLGK